MKKYLLLILMIVLTGCYGDTIDNLKVFSVQVPIFFDAPFVNRSVPDTSVDFTNLYKYPEYANNKQRIARSEILQLNYRVDSLILGDGSVFDPAESDLEFEYVKFSLQFAKPITPNEGSWDAKDFVPDPDQPVIPLGEFRDVKIKDYYRAARHILEVPDQSARALSDGLKTKSYFFMYTEYSKIKGQTVDEYAFKLIKAKFDMIIRLDIKL